MLKLLSRSCGVKYAYIMNVAKYYVVVVVLIILAPRSTAQTALNGRFFIHGLSDLVSFPTSNYSIEGTFTDPNYIHNADEILKGDMIADAMGKIYRIDLITNPANGTSEIIVDVTYISGSIDGYDISPALFQTGTLFRPTSNGYPVVTYDPENNNPALMISVQNTAIQNISDDILKFTSGTTAEMPASPNIGAGFYNTTEKKLYIYNGTTWMGVGSGVVPTGTSTEFPDPATKGDMFFNTEDNSSYIYNGTIWLKISTNGSVPNGIFNPDPATVTVNEGALFYNTSDHKLYVYNGTVWMPSDNILPNGQVYVGNTTNIATAVTMSGDATINNSGKLTVVNKAITDDKLDKLNIPLSGFGNPTDNVSFGDGTTNNRAINLANPTGAQDAATKNYVDALFTNPTALLSLPSGNFFVGNLTNKAVATSKNTIPLSGFGAAAADVAVGGFKLTNVANPTAAQDAATKNYVDTRIIDPANITLASTSLLVGNASGKATAVTKNTISLSGFGNPITDVSFGDGTVNFKIVNLANPVAAQDAATKNYVDSKAIDAASLNLALGSMFVGNASGKAAAVLKSAIPLSGFAPATADIALGNGTLNFKITNLLDPTAAQDATTKKYVDDLFSTPSTSLALATGKVFVGNASGKAVASATSTIPVSGFGKATATLNMGDATTQYNISYLAEPLFPQDAATKNYVDSKSFGSGSISSTDLDISGGNNATMTDVVLSLRDNSVTDAKLDKTHIPLSGFAPAEADIELGDGTNNYKIVNLATPVSGDLASTAATKGYVDNAVSSSSISGKLYQGTVADLTDFMNLGWSGISSATVVGTGISGTICTLSQTAFTWIAYPKGWGNQDFFYKYDGETYVVFSGFQKRIIPASTTGSVDYQVLIFLTTPDREVSLITGD